MRDCGTIERRISAYGDGELSAEQRGELQRHLARCSRCRARFAEMERLQGVLVPAFALPVEPDAGLPDLVMAALSREPYRPTHRKPFFTGLPLRTASVLAAAAALIASFGIGSHLRVAPAPDAPTFAQAPFPHPVIPRSIHDGIKSLKGKIFRRHFSPTSARSLKASPPYPESPVEAAKIAAVPVVPPLTVPVAARKEKVSAKTVVSRKSFKPVAAIRKALEPSHRETPETLQKPGVGEAESYLASARLQQVAGVALTRNDDTGWCNIPPDTDVRVDQRVRSGQASQVAMSLGGVELRMNEETEVIPVRAPQPDAPYWVVRLINGEVFAKVPKGAYGLKVLTPAGDATSKAGEFIVRTNDLFETRLLIAKGAASLENEGARSPGLEGMQVSSRLGSPPDIAQPAVDPDAFQWAYAPLRDDLPFRKPN